MTEKRSLTRLLIILAAGLLIFAAVFLLVTGINYSFKFEDSKQVFTCLSDASLAAGIILFCIGGLSLVAKQGVFDGLGYSVESILVVRNWSPKRRFSERESFADYKQRKQEKREKNGGTGHYFIAGGIYILCSILFFVIYASI